MKYLLYVRTYLYVLVHGISRQLSTLPATENLGVEWKTSSRSQSYKNNDNAPQILSVNKMWTDLIVLLQDLSNRDPARFPFQLVLALFPMGNTTELLFCVYFVFKKILTCKAG